MSMLFFPFLNNEELTGSIAIRLKSELGSYKLHTFPDGESLITIHSDVKNKKVVIVCSLNTPNEKIVPLYLFAKTAKELGAKEVVLVAPYLAYMRQDKQFNNGEGITSHYFAHLLSSFVDNIITLDPHLHRIASLDEIYTVPATSLQTANLIMLWIKENIINPLLIGPDSESEQWVSQAAKEINAPYIILEKNRMGDKEVYVSVPDIDKYKQHTPVLVDDIISTAKTMIQTVKNIKALHMKSPVCIGIHAVFAGDAYQDLLHSGAEKIITCNTIKHITNQIDVSGIIADLLKTEDEKMSAAKIKA
jgi:ribose-phosphate pyrophosphokinase